MIEPASHRGGIEALNTAEAAFTKAQQLYEMALGSWVIPEGWRTLEIKAQTSEIGAYDFNVAISKRSHSWLDETDEDNFILTVSGKKGDLKYKDAEIPSISVGSQSSFEVIGPVSEGLDEKFGAETVDREILNLYLEALQGLLDDSAKGLRFEINFFGIDKEERAIPADGSEIIGRAAIAASTDLHETDVVSS